MNLTLFSIPPPQILGSSGPHAAKWMLRAMQVHNFTCTMTKRVYFEYTQIYSYTVVYLYKISKILYNVSCENLISYHHLLPSHSLKLKVIIKGWSFVKTYEYKLLQLTWSTDHSIMHSKFIYQGCPDRGSGAKFGSLGQNFCIHFVLSYF